MAAPTIIRQGDILLRRVESAPVDLEQRKPGSLTLGYGEATGHTHILQHGCWLVAPDTTDADLREFALGRKTLPVFVVAPEPTTLTHQEHSVLDIPAGVYQVTRQREYSPQAIRIVAD